MITMLASIGLPLLNKDAALTHPESVGKPLATVPRELTGEQADVGAGDMVVVPAGTRHNFVNTGSSDMRLYTVYAPPEHAPGTIHRTKADAASEPEHVPTGG